MAHGDPEPMITIVTLILIAWLLVSMMGYTRDLDASEAIGAFFGQPRVLFIYAFALIIPLTFFKWFPGTLPMFIAALILSLVLKAGAN